MIQPVLVPVVNLKGERVLVNLNLVIAIRLRDPHGVRFYFGENTFIDCGGSSAVSAARQILERFAIRPAA